jgi:hypothetical protein
MRWSGVGGGLYGLIVEVVNGETTTAKANRVRRETDWLPRKSTTHVRSSVSELSSPPNARRPIVVAPSLYCFSSVTSRLRYPSYYYFRVIINFYTYIFSVGFRFITGLLIVYFVFLWSLEFTYFCSRHVCHVPLQLLISAYHSIHIR